METLARSATAHVQRCAHCNCIAIHIGPMTLRFDASAAESLWNTLGQALTRLELELELGDEPAPLLGHKTPGSA